jgi:hypothetical protein
MVGQTQRRETAAARGRGTARALLVIAALLPTASTAQTGPDVNALVVRGIRRVILRPQQTLGRAPTLSVQFIDMRPETATRCVDSRGTSQPNALGRVELRLPGIPHPETASRDFKRALQRDKGFDLEVTEGFLKLQTVAAPPVEPRVVDFRGGHAALRRVLPATDADRELRAFDSPRKLLLVIEAPGGERLELPLFLTGDS